ncbi:MAG: LamG domain-containing protein [Myxococcales bacterium]
MTKSCPFRAAFLLATVPMAALMAVSGCLTAPEQCAGCLTALANDAGPNTGGSTPSGGAIGSGGNIASGEVIGTGGTGTGGGGGTGGAATGGSAAAGGSGTAATGGTGSAATGGSGTGTGGRGTGGAASGGASTGGAAGGKGGGGSPGTGGASGSPGSGLGGNGTDSDLVLWYKFDEPGGTMAADSAASMGAGNPGTLSTIGTGATASFVTTGHVGSHAVKLTPVAGSGNVNGAFVTVPALQTLAPAATTIATWVNLAANTTAESWARVFDYNTGKAGLATMFLTVRAADSSAPTPPVRFAITTTGHAPAAEQRLEGLASLTANAWHHIAVVLPAGTTYTGTLYIDGVAVATNRAMTLHPRDLGATTSNWLGRSQFSGADGSNPGLNGMLDDFRVYRRALSAGEISALFALR